MSKIEKIAIFGALGMTGVCVLSEAVKADFNKIKILLRDPTKMPDVFKDLPCKLEIIQGNVTKPEDVDKTVEGVDAVIVVLGTRNNLEPTTELSKGTENIVASMKKYNVKIVSVCLSSFLFYEQDKVPQIFTHINEEHKRMLEILKSSDLNYIAVCPPGIADNPKSEYIVKQGGSPGGRIISKYELAEFLVVSLSKEEHYRQSVGICSVSSCKT